jgi:hypothetical protein
MFESILAQKLPSPELEEFRDSLRPLNPVPVMPSDEEIESTRAKLEGFPVEFEGKVHNFESATLAYMFRNKCKAEGKTANVLF